VKVLLKTCFSDPKNSRRVGDFQVAIGGGFWVAARDYWKNVRKVKFVGVFAYNKERFYTAAEWELLKKVDWLELDPPQMKPYLKMKECQ
jgi:hypothetical protein